MVKQVATIEGMSCEGCANTVQTKFSQLTRVSDVQVNLDENTATLNTESSVTENDLKNALEDTPYEVKDMEEA